MEWLEYINARAIYAAQTSEFCSLFHPRQQKWSEHFRFQSVEMIGLTAIGRTIVQLLQLNNSQKDSDFWIS